MEKTITAINEYLNKDWNGESGEVKLVSTVKQPHVQKRDLESIKDVLGTFSTYCGSGQTRVVNIKNGVKKINGSVIMPGEEFSAGKRCSHLKRATVMWKQGHLRMENLCRVLREVSVRCLRLYIMQLLNPSWK